MDCNWLIGECDFNRMSQNSLSVEVPFIRDLDEVRERAMWLSEKRGFPDEGTATAKEEQRSECMERSELGEEYKKVT